MTQAELLSQTVEYRVFDSSERRIATVRELDQLVKKNLNIAGLDAAAFYVTQLIEQAPKLGSAYVSVAILYLNRGQYGRAAQAAETALSLGAVGRQVHIVASMAYREDGQIDEALRLIRRAHARHPDGPRIKHELEVCENLLNSSTPSQKVAIVTTLIDAEQTIESYIDYHLQIGIDHLYLFFDDNSEVSIQKAEKFDQVTVIKNDSNLPKQWTSLQSYDHLKRSVPHDHMARQLLNVELANKFCLQRGIQWLLHIDVDELFYAPQQSLGDYFKSLAERDVYNVRFLNHEAVPPSDDVGDYFRYVSLFKANPATLTAEQRELAATVSQLSPKPFLFYGNGKSAARVRPNLLTRGVHYFSALDPFRFEVCDTNNPPYVLHYPCCGFNHFLRKYQTLGAFSNTWLGGADITESIGSFHTDARDVVALEDTETVRNFFDQRAVISDPTLIQELLENGVLMKIETPMNLLNSS